MFNFCKGIKILTPFNYAFIKSFKIYKFKEMIEKKQFAPN